MPSISDRSVTRSLSGYTRRLTNAAASIKPSTLEIHIDNHYQSKVYTTGSSIAGHVSIRAPNDVRFDSVQILLLGTTKTRVDGVSIPQATSHTFLKLVMPIPETYYPVPRVLEAGRACVVPFHFVVPEQLTLGACGHSIGNDAVRAYHLRLPPTVGAASWGRDDLAPDMSRVEYAIKARVLRHQLEDEIDVEAGGQMTVRLFEASQEVRVLPTYAAEPPLGLTPQDRLYTTSRSKAVRKTLLSPKLGRVTVSAAQPGAAMLSPDGRESTTTTARLDFRFEPAALNAGDAAPPPPKITAVSAKISAVTFFSASGMRCFPNLGDWDRHFGHEASGSYSGTTSVPSCSVAAPSVVWRSQRPAPQARRDSGYGSDDDNHLHSNNNNNISSTSESEDRPSDQQQKKKKKRKTRRTSTVATAPGTPYAASLDVPVRLPVEKKAFLPTFHSCITSRVYVLWLTATLSCGGGSRAPTRTTTSLTLAIPLQVGVEAAAGATPGAISGSPVGAAAASLPPSFDAAVRAAEDELAEREADEHLRPRVVSFADLPPSPMERRFGMGGGGDAQLPMYTDITGRRPMLAAA